MTDRIACCVPFCRRTRRPDDGDIPVAREWICGPHWQGVSRETRARKVKWYRLYRVAGRRNRGDLLPRLDSNCRTSWARCKCEAIEAAAGIIGGSRDLP